MADAPTKTSGFGIARPPCANKFVVYIDGTPPVDPKYDTPADPIPQLGFMHFQTYSAVIPDTLKYVFNIDGVIYTTIRNVSQIASTNGDHPEFIHALDLGLDIIIWDIDAQTGVDMIVETPVQSVERDPNKQCLLDILTWHEYSPSWSKALHSVVFAPDPSPCCHNKTWFFINNQGWVNSIDNTIGGTSLWNTGAEQNNCYFQCDGNGSYTSCPPEYPSNNSSPATIYQNVEGALTAAISAGDITSDDKTKFFAAGLVGTPFSLASSISNGDVTGEVLLTGTISKAVNSYEFILTDLTNDTTSGAGTPSPADTIRTNFYWVGPRVGGLCIRPILHEQLQLNCTVTYSHGVLCVRTANSSKAWELGVKI